MQTSLSSRISLILAMMTGAAALALLWVSFTPLPARTTEALPPETKTFSPEEAVQVMLQLEADDFYTYTDPEYGFSFRYPRVLNLNPFEDGVVVERRELGMGFQIGVSPAPEGESSVTEELIRRENPGLLIKDVGETVVGPYIPGEPDTHVLLFTSEDPRVGETLEAWFIRDGHFYQIMLYAPEAWREPWMLGILSQLEFADIGDSAM